MSVPPQGLSHEAESASAPITRVRGKARIRRRRALPRFGLRTLFVFAILFCLFFAWGGKRFYRVRQELLAVETLKQAAAKFSKRDDVDYLWDDPRALEGYDPLGSVLGRTTRPVITHVRLSGSDADDPKLQRATAALVQFPEIESVELQGPAFGEASLAHLSKLPRLESVALLDQHDLTTAGIAQLGSPLKIRTITLGYGDVSEEAVEALAALPELETLVLVEIVPTDGDVYASLAKAPRLKNLEVRGAWVRDQDMAKVAKLVDLEELTVHGITDVGLSLLAPLSNLRTTRLAHPVTGHAAAMFALAHRRCMIEWTDSQNSTHHIIEPSVP